jgi:dTDP-4-amino-4,6-dideoxygalactose transaminase
MSVRDELAAFGGTPAVPKGTYGKWPPVDEMDRENVLASLSGENHAFGPNCGAFQTEFAAWNGNKHAIFTNSGTAALHMAVAACGIGAGDHVLVPAYSWSSSATCIIHHNAIPVFVDIDFDTMNMDTSRIEAAITPRTRAIIVVHLHGLAVNMDRVMVIARRHGLNVIEDACQSHGALFRGRKVGTFGDCAAFSFNQNKCLCSGEGGMFVTDDDDLRRRAVQVWNFGETATPSESRDYHAYALGWMYRGNDLTAAFGRAQLAKLDRHLRMARENAALLLDRLRDLRGLILPVEPEGHTHTYYNFTCRVVPTAFGWTGEPKRFVDAIMKALQAEGVPAHTWQRFMLPMMTVFRARNAYGRGCPWACANAGEGVSYDPAPFPNARRHCDTHFGMTTPLRAPNGPETAEKTATAIRKVLDVMRKVGPEEILAQQTSSRTLS